MHSSDGTERPGIANMVPTAVEARGACDGSRSAVDHRHAAVDHRHAAVEDDRISRGPLSSDEAWLRLVVRTAI